ncbi:MAG TPA: hypothetical protein VH500_10490 [Nitrososphaeraceae archaeon]|jgi:hypothetical protein
MVAIKTITLMLETKNIPDGGIDSGNVYLGICGREFRIESADEDDDDFEPGSAWTYILGDDPPTMPPGGNKIVHNTTEDDMNTPTKVYPLDTDLLVGPLAQINFRFPVYIRLDPDPIRNDHWALARADCYVNPGTQTPDIYFGTLFREDAFLWLGTRCGKYCYLGQWVPTMPRR